MMARNPIARTLLALLVSAPLFARAADPNSADARKAASKDIDLGRKKAAQAPDTSLAGSIQAKGKKVEEEKGPTLNFETFRYQVELEVSGKRQEEIRDLQQLIQLGGNPQEMPSWLFRLGELYWEESEYYFFQSNRKDDQIIQLGKNPDPAQVQQIRAEQKELLQKSKSFQAEAIARYKEIAKKFPKYERLDEVLFALGENMSKQKDKQQEALGVYKLLITKFPKSKYVPDAWMAFGEFYFNNAEDKRLGSRNENLAKALEAYKKAGSYTESTVYGYALYKQAWVYYNLGQWGEALDLFKSVIFFGDLPTSTIANDKKLALIKEARKDYVRTYSHVGSPSAAKEDFRKVGGDGWKDMLKGLAQLYFDEGKDKEAILVYRELINDQPLSPDAPLFQSRIVTCAGRIGNKRYTVQQAELFVKILHDLQKSGVVKDQKGKKSLADAKNDAENTLRTLAVQYHNEYRKQRDDATAQMAKNVYEDYLAVFPLSHHAYEMRFFFAELLYSLEQFERAGDEYSIVAYFDICKLDPKSCPDKIAKAMEAEKKAAAEDGEQPDDKKRKSYLKDSLESAVFAYDEVAKKFEETEHKAQADWKTKLPIPKPKKSLLDACERYAKYVPKGDKYVEVEYKAAQIYYRYNYFDEAEKRFLDIAQNHPKHDLASYSANLVLDIYNIKQDWKGLNDSARKFYANADLMKTHQQLHDDLVKVIEESSFKLVEQYERDQNYMKAAESYLTFVKEWPKSRHAPDGLFNASIDYFKAHHVDKAVAVREQLVKQFPTNALAPKCIYANAGDYEAIADFEKAADYYERYFNEWVKSTGRGKKAKVARAATRKKRGAKAPEPDQGPPAVYEEQKAQDALFNAGIFRDGLKEYGRAIADRTNYIETWPNAKETPKVFLSIADIYDRQHAVSKEVKQIEEYQKKYARDPNDWLAQQYRIVKLFEKAKNKREAEKGYQLGFAYYRQHRAKVSGTGPGMPVVAQAMYLDLEPDFEKYDKIDFRVSSKALKGQLQLKGKKLLELQKKYTEIVNLKQAESAVCSLYRIGLAYKHFAQALYDAPIPKDVPKQLRTNPQFIEQYKNTLAEQAQPVEQKSVEGLEYAMTKAREYDVVNDCSKKATEILVKYKPDRYGTPPEAFAQVAAQAAPVKHEGNGLVAALEPIPVLPPGAEQEGAEDVPGLQAKAPPAAQQPARPGEQPQEGDHPPDDEIKDAHPPDESDTVPVKKEGQGEEDLLP